MKTRLIASAAALATSVVLAGCVGTPTAPDADRQHPANVHAEASPVPALESGLLSLTNAVAQPATPQSEQEHQHGHKK